MLFGVVRDIKMTSDWLECVLVILVNIAKVFVESVTYNRLPVSPLYNFLHKVQVVQWMTLEEVHVKRSVILTDRLHLAS